MIWTELQLSLPQGPVRAVSRGDGPLLLWTHGVFHPIDVDDRTPLPGILSELEGCRVVRYDTRGHGRTPPAASDDAHRWDRLADELLGLADALGAERFIAGGISMGAAVSLHAAVKRPDRLAALALLAPPTGWESRPPQLEEYRVMAALGSTEAVADKVQGDLERDLGKANVTDALRFMVEGIRAADWDALSRVLRGAALSDLPAKERLASLKVPTVVMPWENDPGHPLATAQAIANTVPGASLHIVEGVADERGILGGLREAFARSGLGR